MQGGKWEKSNMRKFKRTTTVGHISSTSWIPFLFFSNIGKLEVQRFKRCANRSWNEEVMAVWRQLHQAVRKFCSCEMRCKTHLWHASAISQPMPPSSQLWTTWEITSKLKMKLRIISKLQNHLQVVKSPLSCKTKVQTCKMDNLTCESPCEIHLCKLRYLQLT